MNNLLPRFDTFNVDEKDENVFTHFEVDGIKKQEAKLESKGLPHHLQIHVARFKADSDLKNEEFRYGVAPPNAKYLNSPRFLANKDPSPICQYERGYADETIVSMPSKAQLSISTIDFPNPGKAAGKRGKKKDTLVHLLSTTPKVMDLYLQTAASIHNIMLRPFCAYTRLMQKTISNNPKTAIPDSGTFTRKDALLLAFTTVKRHSIQMTVRQEIREFIFKAGPIGMEVAVASNRLSCIRILPNSQAASYGSVLDGAEIYSVNNDRVFNLKDFQNKIIEARQNGEDVIVHAASYKGKRMKVDDLYVFPFRAWCRFPFCILFTGNFVFYASPIRTSVWCSPADF